MEIIFNNSSICIVCSEVNGLQIRETFTKVTGVNHKFVYFLQNGKLVQNQTVLCGNTIYAVLRNVGGKGGFGSMLRAIGAQIEKTTNREACRDLSGRRLRDINEEKRLKTWINQQVEREQEAVDRKKKNLEKLCERPKHHFQDETYDRERSELPEKVEEAVLQGLSVADNKQTGEKRKQKQMDNKSVVRKKPKLWVDVDVDELSSSNSDVSDNEATDNKNEVRNYEIASTSAS